MFLLFLPISYTANMERSGLNVLQMRDFRLINVIIGYSNADISSKVRQRFSRFRERQRETRNSALAK